MKDTPSKTCPHCQLSKPLDQYYHYYCKTRSRYRTSSYCMSCSSIRTSQYSKTYYQKNKAKKRAYEKRYRQANPDKIKAIMARYNKKYIDQLHDGYVATQAADVLKCTTQEIHGHPELLQAYRTQLLLKRTIRSHAKKQTHRPQ